ncbi:MAG TPA: hypothetical protein VNF47_22610 [Streptosporangiaceae bacterium]|nr:hypothetical protein [Streptosporangiaceae bacterium]
MTRTPRVTQILRDNLPGKLGSKKALAYAGAGLALAGVGAGAAAGLLGATASAVSAAPGISHAVAAVSAQQQRSPGNVTAARAQVVRIVTRHVAHSADRHASTSVIRHPTRKVGHAATWAAIERVVARRTGQGAGHRPLPAADRLIPAGTTGPQAWMPITPARYDNARTIVRQALDRHMGLRSAVIAVATAMQESALLNINYGTSDSLGLFQQRPSMGWGSTRQLMHPAYAADSFLKALRSYQAGNPGWAHQPLWQPAQSVQCSAFPTAYAKWETQAAHLVKTATQHLI